MDGAIRQQRILAKLRKELDEAQARFLDAKRHHAIAKEYAQDLGAVHPDGALAITQALQAEHMCRQKFANSLSRFNAFVLYGTIPPGME
jgi:hypothetical protein